MTEKDLYALPLEIEKENAESPAFSPISCYETALLDIPGQISPLSPDRAVQISILVF